MRPLSGTPPDAPALVLAGCWQLGHRRLRNRPADHALSAGQRGDPDNAVAICRVGAWHVGLPAMSITWSKELCVFKCRQTTNLTSDGVL
jgi:hypothetical protein